RRSCLLLSAYCLLGRSHLSLMISCPPNWLRSALRNCSAKTLLPCDTKRVSTDSVMTDAGMPHCSAHSTVHLPSPDSVTNGLMPLKSISSAFSERSSSQDAMTEPLRQVLQHFSRSMPLLP